MFERKSNMNDLPDTFVETTVLSPAEQELESCIPPRFLKLGKPEFIGRGSSGCVFRLGEKYALKAISCRDNKRKYAAMNELFIMEKLSGVDGVVQLLGSEILSWDDDTKVYLLMDYCVPMMDCLKNNVLSHEECFKLGIRICEVLSRLWDMNILHLDIQPKNIFVDDRGNFLLGDFGPAADVSKSGFPRGPVGLCWPGTRGSSLWKGFYPEVHGLHWSV